MTFLNSADVTVRFAPTRSTTAPLAAVLVASFAAGGLLVGLVSGVRASTRGWQRWRAERRARRAAARAALTARAERLVWAGDYGQARRELMRAEGSAPSDATRLLLLAETHLHEGEPAAARRLLEEGLPKVGLDPRLLDLLAEAAERMGDTRGAAEALERARRALPESPRLARRLRDVHAAAGHWSEALAIQGEIMLRVHDTTALAAEEQVLHGLRYEAALAEADARRAARLLTGLARENRSFVPAWVSAGDRYAAAGRRLAARRTWERGTRHEPAAVLLDRLERLNLSEGRPERTTRLYRRLLRRHTAAPGVRLLFARYLLLQNALPEAEEVLSGLPPELAGQPLSHALWGELNRRRGNFNVAADTYTRALGADLGLVAPFRCGVCRRVAEAWAGYCSECRRWGTYRARAERVGERS